MLPAILSQFAVTKCPEPSFFGLPTWYHYLNVAGKMDYQNHSCDLISFQNGFKIGDLALVGLGVLDILLRVAALAAVGYVVYGGVQFITAQGEADKIKNARQTIINALIGLGITLVSTGLVSFIGERIG